MLVYSQRKEKESNDTHTKIILRQAQSLKDSLPQLKFDLEKVL